MNKNMSHKSSYPLWIFVKIMNRINRGPFFRLHISVQNFLRYSFTVRIQTHHQRPVLNGIMGPDKGPSETVWWKVQITPMIPSHWSLRQQYQHQRKWVVPEQRLLKTSYHSTLPTYNLHAKIMPLYTLFHYVTNFINM